MALDVPKTATEVDQRMKVDISREVTNSNPFLKNSWIGALATALSNRVFDFYFALRRAELEAIPDTAVLTLEQWAAIWKVLRKAASPASGRLAVIGTAGGVIITGADATSWVASGGEVYKATAGGSIALQSLSVASITRVGSVATLTTDNDHLIASNVLITVTGAGKIQYNVTNLICTVTGPKTLTYAVTGSPATPATGTILLGFTSVSIPVQSDDFGLNQNQLLDTVLTLQSPITDVNNKASVDTGTLGSGADQETLDALNDRFTNKIQNPIANFNVSDISEAAKAIAGVTRVFIQEITPVVGAVTIHFMRDNDPSPIPDASEVLVVKTAIDAIKPATSDTLSVIVSAPTPISTAFTFSAISPSSSTMKTAIEDSLKQFFASDPLVGGNIVEEAYNAAIFNTVDLVTGKKLVSFTLTAPVGDIVIAAGEIGTLGNVTFT